MTLSFIQNVALNEPQKSIYAHKNIYYFLPTDRPTPAGGGPETPYLILAALKWASGYKMA
jgi:hypothetical protein